MLGSGKAGDSPLSRESELGDEAEIATGDDGNAAMLVDEDNLVELCASTKMKLKHDDATGGRIIEVGAGTTRIIVDPTKGGEPLQISTPAAIATIMGTVVYVTVDPASGETTIASEDHPVQIKSSDPNVSGSTTINGMESVTLTPGEAPERPEKMARSVLENISGCLANLHGVALDYDRVAAANRAQDRLARADGELAELPPVGIGPEGPGVPDGAEQGIEDPANVISPTDIVQLQPMEEEMYDYPEPCGGIPGDGCFPFPNQGEDF
jgi:hypothetical protein